MFSRVLVFLNYMVSKYKKPWRRHDELEVFPRSLTTFDECKSLN